MRCSPFSCCVTQRRRTTARVLLSPVPTTSSTPLDSPHVNVEHHAHGPSPQLLLSRHSILYPFSLTIPRCSLFVSSPYQPLAFSFSPDPKAPINPDARMSESRAPLRPTDSRPRLACRRVGRVCWCGAMSGAERALRIVLAHMSASFTATSSSTSLPFPLLSFFPPPVLLDRSADAPVPVYPRSSSFLSALSLVPAPTAGNPLRKPQIRFINAGGRLSALVRARLCSASPALPARFTHSAGNVPAPSLPYTLFARPSLLRHTHSYLVSFPSPPPAPFGLPLVPTHHTRLDATPSSPLSFPLASCASLTYTCAYDCMLFLSPISLHTYISTTNPISDTSNNSIVCFVRLSSCLNALHHRQRLQSIQFN
jgi:hypothetical protein